MCLKNNKLNNLLHNKKMIALKKLLIRVFMNKGEEDELKAKLSLIYWRDNNINNIQTVGYNDGQNYLEYPSHNLTLNDIKNLDKTNLRTICNDLNINIASSRIKADVTINNENISLKSTRGALPALINHTHREGIQKVCNRINLNIASLDNAINNYWIARQNGQIGEDIKMSTPNNPFLSIINDLSTLLEYFLFRGTASGNSLVQAVKLIEFNDPTNYNTWTYYTPSQAISQYINNTTISIRSKAMPSTYNHTGTTPRDQSISKWTRFSENKYKGTLHIRG